MREPNAEKLADKKVLSEIDGWSAWGEAIENNYKRLLKYGLKLTHGDYAYAEDIVHQAICRVFRRNFDPTVVRSAYAYLCKTMSYVYHDSECQSHRHLLLSYDDELNEGLQNQLVDEEKYKAMQLRLEEEELSKKMLLRLGPLNKRERELLSMYVEGMNAKEIASVLNEDRHLIASDLNAIRAKLRYRLRRLAKV